MIQKEDYIMANIIQVQLPVTLAPLLDDIRKARERELLPTTNRAIFIEALKALHSKVKK